MLDINIWEICLYIVNIVILFLFLRWLLYKPISKFLNNRSDGIKKQLEEAAQKQAEAERQKAKYDTMVVDAQDLASEILNRSKTLADEQSKQIIEDATEQAKELQERAEKLIEEQKKQAILEMRQQVTDIAIQIASKILEREVSYQDNKQIIDSFFEKVS